MTLIKPFLLAIMLSIASNAAGTSCPVGWLPDTFHGTKCCPGTMVIDEEGAYCCRHSPTQPKLYATATTTGDTNWSTVDNSCIAEVRFTATDYSAQVSSASSKAEATPTNDSTNEVTSTSATTSRTTSGAILQTSTSTPTLTSTPTPTSNAAMTLATAKDIMRSGAVFAAAFFML
ncbi:hypothetical protein N7453_003159 [Penicillium expansum]|nr:hypothetical protein N7453_003159 [Penicillium expansum]